MKGTKKIPFRSLICQNSTNEVAVKEVHREQDRICIQVEN